jgi:glycine/D-amino acid oxidase-like deaminating enzyme
VSTSPDVAVIGAGIVGCALAAFLAEGGASVLLVERHEVAAGASGRNSGIVQHPMEAALVPLFDETVAHYRQLAAYGFELPPEPHGILVLAEREAQFSGELDVLRGFPELRAELLPAGEPAALEPVLATDLAALRIQTGYAVPPAAATRAFAARAAAAGATLTIGSAALVAGGIAVDGNPVAAGAVVVAAGPWTSAVVDPTRAWRPITPLWGVNLEVRLAEPPRHALEEAGVEALVARGGHAPPIFSLATAAGSSSLGSTFLPEEPDPRALEPRLRERGARFVPALAGAAIASVRACARPLSADGFPLLGRAPGRAGVYIAAGHGPWGISLGPASARRVADLVLGRPAALSPAFDPARFAAT